MAIYHRNKQAELRSSSLDGPGSNGFWQRETFSVPGTYTWTADRDGRVKIQGLGAAGGGYSRVPGPSAPYGEKLLNVTKGQTLTIVIGAGAPGANTADTSPAAVPTSGTTSISGDPVGPIPLVITGSKNGQPNASQAAERSVLGVASGPWDKSFPGNHEYVADRGSPSSGSPFGAGRVAGGRGGAGWAPHPQGASLGDGGPSAVAPKRRAGLRPDADYDFWDMAHAENAGPLLIGGISPAPPRSGVGVGGNSFVSNFALANPSLLGGGTACPSPNGSINFGGSPGGPGAGGGAASATNTNNVAGGKGGDAFVFVFWDEGVD